ncbi:MAG: redoxin domain-containing protein [Myxococcota bacterium]
MHITRSVLSSLALAGLLGCDFEPDYATTVDADGGDVSGDDRDGDGLSDTDEAALGTDPDVSDTDGDGVNDGDEQAAGTNPLYTASRPYTGGYNVGYCADGMATPTGPTGPSNGLANTFQAGDVVDNFTLYDQHGEAVELYSFCGQVVMLAFGAEWCTACRSLAQTAQAEQDRYGPDGFQIIEILIEDTRGGPPGITATERWAYDNGLFTIPVLDDGAQVHWSMFELDFTIPSTVILDRDGTVLSVDARVTDPSPYLD